jgi:hypothetical protein
VVRSRPGVLDDDLVDATRDTVVVRESRRPAFELICVNKGTIVITRTPTGLHYTYTGDNREGAASSDLVRE